MATGHFSGICLLPAPSPVTGNGQTRPHSPQTASIRAIGTERLQVLRVTRNELVKCRNRADALAGCIDQIITAIDGYLEPFEQIAVSASHSRLNGYASRHAHTPRPTPVLAFASSESQGDGSFAVKLDAMPPFRLSPELGLLFLVLAEDAGHSVGDALVGFKNAAHVIARMSVRANVSGAPAGKSVTQKGLRQAVHLLRKQLLAAVRDGEYLVQTRRGFGWRIAVRSGRQQSPGKPRTSRRDRR